MVCCSRSNFVHFSDLRANCDTLQLVFDPLAKAEANYKLGQPFAVPKLHRQIGRWDQLAIYGMDSKYHPRIPITSGFKEPNIVVQYCLCRRAASQDGRVRYEQTERFDLSEADVSGIGRWIRENIDRVNFLVDARLGVPVLTLLESFLQCRLKPRYEGFKSQRLQG
jgi:hypothetical protein